jgi:hypothetical protein
MRNKAAIASAAALAAVLVCTSAMHSWSCASIGLPETDSTHVALASQRWHGTTAEDLEKGRSAYRDRCSGCHSLYGPGEFTEKQWDTLLPVMQKRARAAQDERVWMEKYVRVHAKP